MSAELQKIAIVGLAFRFPGGCSDENSFWAALESGADLVTEIDPARWATAELSHVSRKEPGRSITFSAGVLTRIDEFDAGFFGISPREAVWMDPQQRLLLELAWESFENAGIPPASVAGSDCAVFVGISGLDYGTRALDDLPSFSAHTMTGNTLSIAANRLSYVFDLHGPSMAIDTACSSSLVAVHQACNALLLGDAGMAMVGGVNALLHPYPFVGFTKASMLSANGRCRTFDAAGDGYVRAEGGAVLLLKTLERAISDGDRIHGVILASGANADGRRKNAMTIPSTEGQVELMRSVLDKAGVDAADVDYLEAHGTGTAIGDPIEANAIGRVYGQARSDGSFLPIGSVKSNLGHLEPASGMAGMVKALLILKQRKIPPSVHLEVPNPQIDFASLQLQPVRALSTLPMQEDRQPIVGVNSFGFGGANAHVLLQGFECLPEAGARPELLPPLRLSARSEGALKELTKRYVSVLQGLEPRAYYDLAYAAAFRREHLDHRLLVPGDLPARVVERLQTYLDGAADDSVIQLRMQGSAGKLAFVYAGNGAQWLGMGQLLLLESPRFAEIIQQLDQKVAALSAFSLLDALKAEPENSRLADTAVAQPLLFAIQVAITQMLQDEGIRPDLVVGHSVGEVAAAWAAGGLSLDEAVSVICARSSAQALTQGQGRMAAVNVSVATMEAWLASSAWPDLEIAGINSPGSLTLSGPLDQLQALAAEAKDRHVAFRLLDLDYAFHSKTMDAIRLPLATALAEFAPNTSCSIPFFSTVTGERFAEALGAEYWWRNVRLPVQFAGAIRRMIEAGAGIFVEIGPHAILQRYLKECLAESGGKGEILPSLRKNDDGIDRIQNLALKLHLLGDGRSLRAYFPMRGRHVDLPNYPWQGERYWLPNTVEGYRLIERRRRHPLLGWPVQDLEQTWENVLDPRVDTWLADHRVGGACVLPGAAYLEMALAASQVLFGVGTHEIEGLDILAPLVFDSEHGRSVRFAVNGRDGCFQIHSRQRLSDDAWTLHAVGRLIGAVCGYRPTTKAFPAESALSLERNEHYRLAACLGLDYGPVFQGLTEVRIAGRSLEGRLEFPDESLSMLGACLLHPAIVDVCFQSLIDFFQEEIAAGIALPLLPIKLGRVRLLSQEQPARYFRTRILRSGLRSVLADFELLGADGQTLAVLADCRFRAASLRKDQQHQPATWLIEAFLKPGQQEAAATHLPSTRSLAQGLKEWFVEHEAALKRAVYFGEAQPLLDALVSAFACEAMQALLREQPQAVQAWLSDAEQPVNESTSLWSWLRELLLEQACLVRDGDTWRLLDDMPPAAEIWRTLLADHPEALPELILIGRMGRGLPALLKQEQRSGMPASEMLASQQREVLLDASLTYRPSRLAIESLLASMAGALPENRRFRILEMTPGYSDIPRQLAPFAATGRLDYVLAHGDAAVCDQLRHEYQEDEWVNVAELAGSPLTLLAKDSLPLAYDVIVLRHSLCRAADPRLLLKWSKGLLAKGGVLILAERYPDLASQLLWGKGRLLSPQGWARELEILGYKSIEICREPAAAGSPVGTYLLLAKSVEVITEERPPETARWVLLAGDAATFQFALSLQELMAAQGQVAVVLEIDAHLDSLEAAKRLLGELQQEFDGAIDQVLLLAGARAPDDTRWPGIALSLVQALTSLEHLPGLSFVTRGGASRAGRLSADACNPAHTALWGFGRVLMNEYPDLQCRLIDIAQTLTASMAELLVGELLHPDGENEILLRPGSRHVLRMRKSALAELHQGEEGTRRFQLDFRVPGQLRNLLWLEQAPKQLAADEIEVRPLATGLNFRDVMYVMGLLPDEAVENGFAGASLGLEFAGIVTRVGQRVDEYIPGDAVMGFGSACFASHVVTRVNAVTPKPEHWSFESAATVPTVFFTVYYALRHLADLQAGERVLIHGAAGGVGIAAVQLARHLGAEVFATAGTDEKREFVALLGADHVFDSRSLSFGEQILALTEGEGVDVVLNSLAGEAIRRNLRILRPFGRFLELGKRDFFENTPIGLRPFKDNISYFGIDADQLLIARPELAARLFREVMTLFRSGALSPLPAHVFPAERIIDAFRYMQQARQIGKVVVCFEGANLPVQALAASAEELRCRADGAYCVTGGLSGFGLETARWLARCGAGQLLLLSRRGESAPGAAEAIASLAALGAKTLVLPCDVSDREALQQALSHPDLLPLRGVFHAAMVLDDALVLNLDPERMQRVLDPKVKGAWHLHELTRELQLEHFMLYSSVTSFLGNPGQANYVAANAWLEGLADLRRAQGLPVTCVAWGPIADAGYLTRNQAVKDSLASRLGAQALNAETALSQLGKLLVNPVEGTVAIADFQFATLARALPSAQGPRFQGLQRQAEESISGLESLDDFKLLIAGKTPAEVQVMVAQCVTLEVAQILAVSPERIDATRSLHDLGLDSLMGVELALGLEKRFGVQVPAMMLNEGPTVERVTSRIMERLFATESATDDGGDLTRLARSMAAQHGESVSGELLSATVADLTACEENRTCD